MRELVDPHEFQVFFCSRRARHQGPSFYFRRSNFTAAQARISAVWAARRRQLRRLLHAAAAQGARVTREKFNEFWEYYLQAMTSIFWRESARDGGGNSMVDAATNLRLVVASVLRVIQSVITAHLPTRHLLPLVPLTNAMQGLLLPP